MVILKHSYTLKLLYWWINNILNYFRHKTTQPSPKDSQSSLNADRVNPSSTIGSTPDAHHGPPARLAIGSICPSIMQPYQASSLCTSSISMPMPLHFPSARPPYPFYRGIPGDVKQLGIPQLQQLDPNNHPAGIPKIKAPFMNRNYLELAMLVCNTFRGKLFPCPHCRYVTDRRNNLKRHISTMHQTCDKVLECCGVKFATKASLREHIMIFHHNGYSCPYCGRRFCRKALLKRHLSVHSGQKDYNCPHCDYATSHKSNLERHKRIHERCKSPVMTFKHIEQSASLTCAASVDATSTINPLDTSIAASAFPDTTPMMTNATDTSVMHSPDTTCDTCDMGAIDDTVDDTSDSDVTSVGEEHFISESNENRSLDNSMPL